jgi:hypothetical protein
MAGVIYERIPLNFRAHIERGIIWHADLEGTFAEAIALLRGIEQRVAEEFPQYADVQLVDDCDGHLEIKGVRDTTPDEELARKVAQQRRENLIEEEEREQLARLKAKYER